MGKLRFELAYGVSFGLLEDRQRLGAESDGTADRVEMRPHGRGVSLRHDESDAGVATGQTAPNTEAFP